MAAGVRTRVAPGKTSSGETASGSVRSRSVPQLLRTALGGGWTTPRRVRALTALCLVALVAFGAVAATVLGGARGSIDTIGHRAAPQAVRASDLYFALSDMDAQAANLLLVGADPADAGRRKATQDVYEQRRAQADGDLQQATAAAAGDPAAQRAVASVLGALGQYEALVARSELLEDQGKDQPGKPSADALDAYRQATGLLRQQLLPGADQVAAASEATVDGSYASQRSDLAAGWWWLLAFGVLALLALGALQRTLTVRYRRLVSPPLALALVLTAAGLVYGLSLVSGADQHLKVAKSSAYDSVIALSRARAVAYDSNADESRYLSDPAGAAGYERSFFDKTQSIATIDGADLAAYSGDLNERAMALQADPKQVGFGGYLGTELRNITFPGEQAAADKVLSTFQTYQADDHKLRLLNTQGRLADAVTFDTGNAPGQSNADFGLLSDAFSDVIGINQKAFDQAVAQSDGDLGAGATTAGLVLLLAGLGLTLVAVRPRLAEYR
ncbi:hypothetical protein P3T36_007853 [Kitasatospora sp. MAP12-15]|uniref:hypothetical protein n=1 Tax=unclassified Kitasatospora TaxID=2633591 RepID=UPI0024753FAD|nr:hypothetical protein [Kitasatospora sp. MAP12-44]MDH6111074.1 hypothetical protein [Kitasatospora sp. MAP12-44]